MDLRLECFNSVDGTSRLVVTFGWLRLVCLNGMVIGETVVERRDVHDRHLSLEPIPDIIDAGLEQVAQTSRDFSSGRRGRYQREARRWNGEGGAYDLA